jgi:hypothetical protein
MDYVRAIATADGACGAIARQVKLADLHDNLTREAPQEMLGMRTPGGRYQRARQIIEDATRDRGETLAPWRDGTGRSDAAE